LQEPAVPTVDIEDSWFVCSVSQIRHNGHVVGDLVDRAESVPVVPGVLRPIAARPQVGAETTGRGRATIDESTSVAGGQPTIAC
jgi:hypothetical protein